MNFIAVHEMLDPQVDTVRLQTDAVAERIATMGGEPPARRVPSSNVVPTATAESSGAPPARVGVPAYR